jgi:hypothetical protein
MTTLIPKYDQGATGAANRPFNQKLAESVSVLDFGADPTGTTDSTTAFTNALTAAYEVRVPDGTYLLNNLRYVRAGNRIVGTGYISSILKQNSTVNPAINCTSDVTTGQLIGVALINVGVLGAVGATIEAVRVEAIAPYVVNKSEFDYKANATYTALKLINTAGNEIYSNKFKVDSYDTTSTAVFTSGTYNMYDLIAERCQNGVAFIDGTINGIFNRVVSDGSQTYGGQNCTIINPTVEGIFGTAVYAPLVFNGFNHVIIRPTLTNVAPAKATGASIALYNQHIVHLPRVWGSVNPVYPFDFGSSPSSTIIGGDILCGFKIDQYVTAARLASITLIGNCSTFSTANNTYPSAPYTISAATYTLDADKSNGLNYSLINNFAGSVTLTLPVTSEQKGRIINVQNYTAQTVVSASANVIPITGGAAGTAILAATAGKWVELQFNGTNWVILSAN